MKRPSAAVIATIALAAVLAFPRTGWTAGPLYFVSPAGNDSNPGTETRPWKTIGKAAESLSAGQTVQVRKGRYNERVVVHNSGKPGAYISFEAYSGEEAVIDGAGIEVLKDEGLFEINGLSYIRVSGFHVVNSAEAGILANDANHLMIEKNRTERTGSSGIGVWGCREVVIDGNEVAFSCSGKWQEAISVAVTRGFEVRYNHVHNGPPECRKEGITLKDGSSNGRVYGNNVHHVQAVGIYVDAWDKHTFDIQVFRNNVHDILNSDGIALASEMGGLLEGIRVYNNVSWNNRFVGIAITTNGDSPTHPMKDISIVNNTVFGNGTGEWGGGINVDNPGLISAVIRNNLSSSNLSFEIAVSNELRDLIAIDHNLSDGRHEDPAEMPGSSPFFGEPRFVNPGGGDFRLRSGSAAIDAGSPAGAPKDDYRGNPRPKGAGVDIGAFEL